MDIAVQWQDADSSSSNAVTELFPDAKVTICGGHARRAHKKQAVKNQAVFAYSSQYVWERFLSIDDVVCHYSRHHSG